MAAASSTCSRKKGANNITRFDVASGAPTEITRGNQGVLRFRASADRSKIVYTLSTPTMVNELFVARRSRAASHGN